MFVMDLSDDEVDDEPAERDALKLAVARLCEAAGAAHGSERRLTPEALATLTELTLRYARARLAPDLAAFAAHCRRTTVNADDVMLVARANSELRARLDQERAVLAAARPPPKPKGARGARAGPKAKRGGAVAALESEPDGGAADSGLSDSENSRDAFAGLGE